MNHTPETIRARLTELVAAQGYARVAADLGYRGDGYLRRLLADPSKPLPPAVYTLLGLSVTTTISATHTEG